jgi:hypothetical protein
MCAYVVPKKFKKVEFQNQKSNGWKYCNYVGVGVISGGVVLLGGNNWRSTNLLENLGIKVSRLPLSNT